jgi:hypothetical protein
VAILTSQEWQEALIKEVIKEAKKQGGVTLVLMSTPDAIL